MCYFPVSLATYSFLLHRYSKRVSGFDQGPSQGVPMVTPGAITGMSETTVLVLLLHFAFLYVPLWLGHALLRNW